MKLKYNVNYHGFEWEYEIAFAQYKQTAIECGHTLGELEQQDGLTDYVLEKYKHEAEAEYREHIAHAKEIEADKRRRL